MHWPFRRPLQDLAEARLTGLDTHIRALYDRDAETRAELRAMQRELQQLREDEVRRAAEHATMVDQLSRLYKRVSARIEREHQTTDSRNGESVAEMRRRLGR